ncbi:hypothetical protein Tco_0514371 [Tanacetum coccineum]|uniref:Uncharacterized protein n=1 Tax=Tanacetum coccineum TaxID=301880 RepID=A0ABQ4XRR5_9ASTR
MGGGGDIIDEFIPMLGIRMRLLSFSLGDVVHFLLSSVKEAFRMAQIDVVASASTVGTCHLAGVEEMRRPVVVDCFPVKRIVSRIVECILAGIVENAVKALKKFVCLSKCHSNLENWAALRFFFIHDSSCFSQYKKKTKKIETRDGPIGLRGTICHQYGRVMPLRELVSALAIDYAPFSHRRTGMQLMGC